MNSLTDLNNFGFNQVYSFQDDRPETYLFDAADVTNRTVITYENDAFPSPEGINFTSIYSRSIDVTYTIDVSSLPGATVSWGTIPANFTVTNPSTGVYKIDGIRGTYDWRLVKNPLISMPVEPPNWSYSSTITYGAGLTKTWTVGVTIAQFEQLTSTSPFNYDEIQTPMNGQPLITNLGDATLDDSAYIMTVTADTALRLGSLVTYGLLGGTSVWNGTSLTITGNLAQVNDHLSTMWASPYSPTQSFTFNLVYQLTNVTEGNFVSTATQELSALATLLLSVPSNVGYYTDSAMAIGTYAANITDVSAPPTDVYTFRIRPTVLNAVFDLTILPTKLSTTSFNQTNQELTLIGTKAQINSDLSRLTIMAAKHYSSTINLLYTVTTPGLLSSSKLQMLPANDSILRDPPIDRTDGNSPIIELTDAGVCYFHYLLPTQIVNVPLVKDTKFNGFVTSAYSLVISGLPNDGTTMTSSGTGGTASQVGTTFVITGDQTQVNSHLNTLYVTGNGDANLSLTYTLTNPTWGLVTTKTQTVINGSLSNTTIGRTFAKNTAQQTVFSTSIPQILETVTDATYELTISGTGIGYFGTTEADMLTTYVFTGTKLQVNLTLNALKFWPIKDVTGAQTFTILLKRNSTSIKSAVVNYVGSGTVTPGSGVYTITTTQTFTPTYEQRNYLYADVLLVGGGGGGARVDVVANGGGGGGGGGVVTATNLTLPASELIVIGDGGAGSTVINAFDGLDTTYLTMTAFGGKGGLRGEVAGSGPYIVKGGRGGNSGSPTVFSGNLGDAVATANPGSVTANGGGGAGAGGVGITAFGGNGLSSNITGVATYYGGGGSGGGTGISGSLGGGGAGNGSNGTNGLGGGGGGSMGGTGGTGGSGVVIFNFHS